MPEPKKPAPHDAEAEESVIGTCLISREAVEICTRLLAASDFYIESHRHIFGAVAEMFRTGKAIDAVTVGADLEQSGVLEASGGRSHLITLSCNVPSITSVQRYAEIVLERADARRLQSSAQEAIEAIKAGADPYETADSLAARCTGIDRVGVIPEGFTTYSQLLDDQEADAPVVIPGLCFADSRVIVVAVEKGGKSVLMRQIAFCASQGVHPFRTDELIEPVRVLVWDLENPMKELRKTGHLLRHRLSQHIEFNPEMLMVFRRPGGIDLTSRHDRGELEAVLEEFRPQLIIGGPIYKMVPEGKFDNDVKMAGAVQRELDTLRIRYGCALILEHHAPIGNKKDGRPLRSMGGQRWQAWPDVSISLKAEDEYRKLVVERPHPERGTFDWPVEFHRGNIWPWEALYPNPANGQSDF